MISTLILHMIDLHYVQIVQNKKFLKRDVDIEIDIDSYDWLILVGSEPFKMYTRKTSITEYNGKIIDDKFLALINPAMIKFKPEAKKSFEEAIESIAGYVSGELKKDVDIKNP